MHKEKVVIASVTIGDILLVASIVLPWIALYGGFLGGAEYTISPADLVWYEASGYASPMTSLPSALAGAIYIAATLGLVLLTVPVFRGARRGLAVATPISAASMAAAIVLVAIDGVIVLLASLVLPVGLQLAFPFPHVGIAAGLPLALGGCLVSLIVFVLYNGLIAARPK